MRAALFPKLLSHAKISSSLVRCRRFSSQSDQEKISNISKFWFESRDKWFAKDASFDGAIRSGFGNDVESALLGKLDHWSSSAEGSLALVRKVKELIDVKFTDFIKRFFFLTNSREILFETTQEHSLEI